MSWQIARSCASTLWTIESLGRCWWSVFHLSLHLWPGRAALGIACSSRRLRRLRLPGALPGGHPVKRGDEVIMGLANSPLALFIIPSANYMAQGVVLQNSEGPLQNTIDLGKKNFDTPQGKLLWFWRCFTQEKEPVICEARLIFSWEAAAWNETRCDNLSSSKKRWFRGR